MTSTAPVRRQASSALASSGRAAFLPDSTSVNASASAPAAAGEEYAHGFALCVQPKPAAALLGGRDAVIGDEAVGLFEVQGHGV